MRTIGKMKMITCGAAALLLCLAGCSSDGGGGGSDDTGQPEQDVAVQNDLAAEVTPAVSYSLVTYNLGLAQNYVDYAEERVEHVVAAVAGLDVELICLQEVWDTDDIDAVIEGTKATFPHSYVPETPEEGGGEPACSEEESGPLLGCVTENCAGAENLADCALENCAVEFGAVSSGCSSCLVANISKPLEEIFSNCAEGSAMYTYGGHSGLMVLSAAPLVTIEHMVLDSSIVRRVVIHAEIDKEGEPLHAFCTHLTAGLDVEYPGEFGSYTAEQAHQIDQVLEYIGEKAGDGGAVLLGDMNNGPAIPPDMEGNRVENFQKFVDAGFVSPYLNLDAPECTWCASNTLIADDDNDNVIDHILFLNLDDAAASLQGQRIFTDLVEILAEGEALETNLSDHFGVWVRSP